MAKLMSRRKFLRITTAGVAGIGLSGIAGSAYITRVEPDLVVITRLTIPVRNLPPAFNGFTLTQISDIHLADWMTLDRMMAIVKQVNALNPDAVAITGDFVSGIGPDTPAEITHFVSNLQARYGVFASLGNHDHWTHAPTVHKAVTAGNAALLRNQHTGIQRGQSTLYVAGVDDVWEKHDDLNAALNGIPANSAVVLLAHEPDFADEVAKDNRVSLQISGHSHGGQVRLPGVGALALPEWGQKYQMGLYNINGMALYTNRGVGMVAPHVRFNCRPEITHFTLTAQA